jgi:hypothetical protein
MATLLLKKRKLGHSLYSCHLSHFVSQQESPLVISKQGK